MKKASLLSFLFLFGCVSTTGEQYTFPQTNFKGDERFAGIWECVSIDKSTNNKVRFAVKWQQIYNPKNSRYYSFDKIIIQLLGHPKNQIVYLHRETMGKLEITRNKIITHRQQSKVLSVKPKYKSDDKALSKFINNMKKTFTSKAYSTSEEEIVSWTNKKLITHTSKPKSMIECTRIEPQNAIPVIRDLWNDMQKGTSVP